MGIIPNRYKRLVFMSSLIPKVSQVRTEDKAAMAEMNTRAVKANDPRFVEASAKTSGLLWPGLENETVRVKGRDVPLKEVAATGDETAIQKVARKVVDDMPASLRYGSDELMCHDVTTVVKESNFMELR